MRNMFSAIRSSKIVLMTALCAFAICATVQYRLALAQNAQTVQLGAGRGTAIVSKRDGDVWEFTEDLSVTFPSKVPRRVTIAPSPGPGAGPWIIRPPQTHTDGDPMQTMEIRWRKVPGTTYTVTVSNAQPQTDNGSPPLRVTVRTPARVPTPERPIASRKNDPYYYGSLEHSGPYPLGLKLPNSGDIDPRALRALVAQHVQFVRFGPTPNEVAYNTKGPQSRESFSFNSTDPTLDKLLANGITVLYVIDAANAPPWGNPNTVHDQRPIYETPALYAEYCGGVAAHLAQKYPRISRVEIGTNEANFGSNWTNRQADADGMPQYADQTGAGLAPYLQSCYRAVKAVAPKIQVVAPGIATGDTTVGFLPFIDQLFAAGCRTGRCWDIFSIHVFSWSNPSFAYDQPFISNLGGPGRGPATFYSYRAAQEEAVKDGDSRKPPVMITETGFSSSPTSPQGLDLRVQALYTSIAFNQYLADPTVRGIVWADILNHESGTRIFNGIATYDDRGQPKPVFDVFKTFATF